MAVALDFSHAALMVLFRHLFSTYGHQRAFSAALEKDENKDIKERIKQIIDKITKE